MLMEWPEMRLERRQGPNPGAPQTICETLDFILKAIGNSDMFYAEECCQGHLCILDRACIL